jgi:hypothetical protein
MVSVATAKSTQRNLALRRRETVSRRDVFEMLQGVRSMLNLAATGVAGHIAADHQLDDLIDRFIYMNDPFSSEAQPGRNSDSVMQAGPS